VEVDIREYVLTVLYKAIVIKIKKIITACPSLAV